jgi:hypothetical protein
MKDARIVEQLLEALNNVELAKDDRLNDFNLEFVAFNCRGEIDPTEPWACPFRPGCGAANLNDCPEIKRRVQILAAPRRRQ